MFTVLNTLPLDAAKGSLAISNTEYKFSSQP